MPYCIISIVTPIVLHGPWSHVFVVREGHKAQMEKLVNDCQFLCADEQAGGTHSFVQSSSSANDHFQFLPFNQLEVLCPLRMR